MRLLLCVGCLAAAIFAAPAAHAQTMPGDFVENVQPTLPSNELLVAQIRDAMPASNLDGMVGQTVDTVGMGEHLERQLSLALALAPDDPARSRIEGVRTH